MVGLRIHLDVPALLTHTDRDLDRVNRPIRSPRNIQLNHANGSTGMLAWFQSHFPSIGTPRLVANSTPAQSFCL